MYVAHLCTTLANLALHIVLATLAAAATASLEATAEVAALSSLLAYERRAQEQAKSIVKTVLKILGVSTICWDASSSQWTRQWAAEESNMLWETGRQPGSHDPYYTRTMTGCVASRLRTSRT
ncbi:hypothetical protein FRC12_003657 [Ceratobasidium sp. 428]|nr:hypothetical protein FRC12_003657 [Ceratobasidium sp. 428]